MPITVNGKTITAMSIDGVPVDLGGTPTEVQPFCVTALSSNTSVLIRNFASDRLMFNLLYSTDNKQTWRTYEFSNLPITLENVGDKVYFKGLNPNGLCEFDSSTQTATRGIQFEFNSDVSFSGNIMSLINPYGADSVPAGGLAHLFENNYQITTAPDLPATSIGAAAYYSMFNGCQSLATLPSISATRVSANCFAYMFFGCESLTSLPSDYLSGYTELAQGCYSCMFSGTGITSIPSGFLPATTLAQNCYSYMFGACQSLTTVPSNLLPAYTVESYSYDSMFMGCQSLTCIPNLLATTTGEYAYQYMFRECTSLGDLSSYYVGSDGTIFGNHCCYNMFYASGVTHSPRLRATRFTNSCFYQMFKDCTSLVSASPLYGTSIAAWCFYEMFYGCTSLTDAPEIRFDPEAESCYGRMFMNCSSLNRIVSQMTYGSTSNMANWVYGVAATGDFYNLGRANLTTGYNGIPTDWTVHTSL